MVAYTRQNDHSPASLEGALDVSLVAHEKTHQYLLWIIKLIILFSFLEAIHIGFDLWNTYHITPGNRANINHKLDQILDYQASLSCLNP